MSRTFMTVPLRYDTSALPIGTISFPQFALSDLSYRPDFDEVKIDNHDQFEVVPMVVLDHQDNQTDE